MATANAIQLRGVNKRFGPKVAVSNLDLTVPEGALIGLIGPNGAGKTTTIRMIMSIIFPDSGSVEVLGKESAVESKDRIGYLPEERGLYKKMKVGPFLTYIARLKGLDGAGLEKKILRWLEQVDLADCYRKRCEELSKGMQQKVQFIASVIHEPDLLILDEPFSGLDPVNSRLLRVLVEEQHQRGCTLIFSTHQMSQAEALCDRVVMIDDGKKVLDNTLSEIRARYTPREVAIDVGDGFDESLMNLIERLDCVESISTPSSRFEKAKYEYLAHVDRVKSDVKNKRVPGHEGEDRIAVYSDDVVKRELDTIRSRTASDKLMRVQLKEGHEGKKAIQQISPLILANRIELVRPTLEDVFIEIVAGNTSSDEERFQLQSMLQSAGANGRADNSGD